jgi:vacuolar-type H+-ATPase subunit I/STV1
MIVPVLKTSLVILKKDRAEALRLLQKHGLIMIDKEEENLKVDTQYEDNLYLRVQNALKHLKDHNGKSKAFGYQEVSYDSFVMDKENRIKLLNQVEHVVQTIETLEASNKP